jgi:hypothetical protein
MMIQEGDDFNAIFGLTLFSSYHIVADRNEGSLNFALGCDCENSFDGYPSISLSGLNLPSSSKLYGPSTLLLT